MRLYNNFGRFFIALKSALLQAIISFRILCQKVVKSKLHEQTFASTNVHAYTRTIQPKTYNNRQSTNLTHRSTNPAQLNSEPTRPSDHVSLHRIPGPTEPRNHHNQVPLSTPFPDQPIQKNVCPGKLFFETLSELYQFYQPESLPTDPTSPKFYQPESLPTDPTSPKFYQPESPPADQPPTLQPPQPFNRHFPFQNPLFCSILCGKFLNLVFYSNNI